MRVLSTAESVDNGEITLLAILETIVATSVAIYLSVTFGSFKWIAWSVCIVPFLLLRTTHSTLLGLDLMKQYTDWALKLERDILKGRKSWLDTSGLVIGLAGCTVLVLTHSPYAKTVVCLCIGSLLIFLYEGLVHLVIFIIVVDFHIKLTGIT